jgi:glycosyltransferase involved in cell wall biosynthesis
MEQPLLSIVIANYNYGHYLEDAILSILSQDVSDWIELIVCDGGSTDNSVEIIKKYENNISWWCCEKDAGQSDAFNKGFSHARGRFGCWLNADDLFVSGALKAVIKYIRRHPKAEWIAGSSIFVDQKLAIKWCSSSVATPGIGCKWLPYYSVNGPSSFFLISNLKKVGGFDVSLRYTMDTDLWRRFVRCGIRLYHMKEYIWCFRIHDKSKTSHKFMTGRRTSAFASEGFQMDLRHGITPLRAKIGSLLNRGFRLLLGAYFISFIDTFKNSGKRITDAYLGGQ